MYIGVFNARNSEWWNGNSTNLQGTELAELEAQYSLNQVIYGPTHILPNSARFIDLIFTKEKKFCFQHGGSSFAISAMPSPINCCKSEFHYFISSS